MANLEGRSIMMDDLDCSCNKRLKFRDEIVDQISNLPDSLIGHILSFTDAKSSVQTSVLAKKWRLQWAYVPGYTFESSTFKTSQDLEDFVVCLLKERKRINISKPFFCFKGTTVESLIRVFCRYGLLYRNEEIDIQKKVHIRDHKLVDRLSSLPDPLKHHILSFMDTKYAVQTCVLSKRWKKHWTSVSTLNFNYLSFDTWAGFTKFVTNVLKHRASVDVRKLVFLCGGTIRVQLTRSVFQYAISHGIEELQTDIFSGFRKSLCGWEIELYKCPTLRTISCCGTIRDMELGKFVALKSLRMTEMVLPSQTDVFCNCYHLENLVLVNCSVPSGDVFCVAAPNIISLTVISDNAYYDMEIDAPGLKFLNLNRPPSTLRFKVLCVLEELNIVTTPSPPYNWYVSALRLIAAALCYAKSISVLLILPKVCWYTHV